MRLIDADALIENIKGYSQIEGTKLSKADEKIIECFISHVEMLEPTVEAKEVVHGEWKEATPKGVHSWSKGYARCSACDETIWSGWEMNFCPKCGCDMRGEKHE